MTETALPGVYSYGKVVARVITAVGDLTDTGDTYPDAVPLSALGSITFTPAVGSRVVAGAGSSTLVQQRAITCDLDANGYLSLRGQPGVWLYTGVWTVTFSGAIGSAAFQIEVTTAHTEISPLDLFAVLPYSPPSGTAVTTMIVPASPSDTQVLMWSSTSGAITWSGIVLKSPNGTRYALSVDDSGVLQTTVQ